MKCCFKYLGKLFISVWIVNWGGWVKEAQEICWCVRAIRWLIWSVARSFVNAFVYEVCGGWRSSCRGEFCGVWDLRRVFLCFNAIVLSWQGESFEFQHTGLRLGEWFLGSIWWLHGNWEGFWCGATEEATSWVWVCLANEIHSVERSPPLGTFS